MATDWTPEEEHAIHSLKQVAAKWPKTLMLFSASGTLLVKHNDDRFVEDETEWIPGIANDGGDPEWERH